MGEACGVHLVAGQHSRLGMSRLPQPSECRSALSLTQLPGCQCLPRMHPPRPPSADLHSHGFHATDLGREDSDGTAAQVQGSLNNLELQLVPLVGPSWPYSGAGSMPADDAQASS